MSDHRTAIVAHGKNWEIPVPPNPEDIVPSIETRMAAEAAGVLFTHGAGDLIIFTGGHTAGPEYPSEASVMAAELYEHFTPEEVPQRAVKLEESSDDTMSNFREIATLLPEQGVDDVILVTIGYHMPRVIRQARIAGLPVRGVARSDYAVRERHGGRSHHFAKSVTEDAMSRQSVRPLVRAGTAYALEAAGWGVSLIDPTGERLASSITGVLRHRDETFGKT